MARIGFSQVQRRLRSFSRHRAGVSAVEFALLLPVMVTMYLGSIEVGTGMSVQFKTTLAARTVADLASQYKQINNSQMSDILGAATAVLTPYTTAAVQVIVSEVTTDANGNATITWSDANANATAHAVGSSVTLPTNVGAANISIIWGEVTYPYNPQFGWVLTGTITMNQKIYFYPRLSTSITRVNS
jgi:Flp pilus assembly protein TadG